MTARKKMCHTGISKGVCVAGGCRQEEESRNIGCNPLRNSGDRRRRGGGNGREGGSLRLAVILFRPAVALGRAQADARSDDSAHLSSRHRTDGSLVTPATSITSDPLRRLARSTVLAPMVHTASGHTPGCPAHRASCLSCVLRSCMTTLVPPSPLP